jgi:hypothetical protein
MVGFAVNPESCARWNSGPPVQASRLADVRRRE